MNFRKVSVKLILTLMSLSTVVAIVTANPIPIDPGVVIKGEDITAWIYWVDGTVWAEVNGNYSLSVKLPMPWKVTMYYPVPPDTTNIFVEKDGTPVDWYWNETYYHICVDKWFSTDFPFINWTITPAETFNITTHYEHPVPAPYNGNTYAFLYAYGSYRTMGWAKWCPANITTYISKMVAPQKEDIAVYLVSNSCDMEQVFPKITQVDNWWKVAYTEGNTTGTKDFLVTIKKPAVGGIVVPVDKFGLLAPYIGVSSTIVVATVASAFYVKRIKRRKEKQ